MSVKFVDPAVQLIAAPVSSRRNGSTRPRPLMISLDQPGRLRVGHLLTLLSISAPTFYRRMKAGEIPPATGNDGRPYWLTSVVREYVVGNGQCN
jgi:predicted DNA-binding transcriptional regulator AlpA